MHLFVTVHRYFSYWLSHRYFAVGERGNFPNIHVFEFPSCKLHRILQRGTVEAYAHLSFNPKGTHRDPLVE
jgi:hypothetical protein